MTITTLIIFKCFFLFVYDIGYDKDKSDFQTHIYRQSPISFSLVNNVDDKRKQSSQKDLLPTMLTGFVG